MKMCSDYTTEDAFLLQKSYESYRAQTSKFLQETCVQMLCVTSPDLQQSQSRNNERDYDVVKRKRKEKMSVKHFNI